MNPAKICLISGDEAKIIPLLNWVTFSHEYEKSNLSTVFLGLVQALALYHLSLY